ncbi:hypothetical protein INS49_009015 [Diaporthe citri]|uniref:uncharacterized protein n=1 Tax=Diaporthe citri TaxID=83186 RepID=UPI001C80C771|nr:uncharacterized protein INS49_009015 [Diaporthe citri]KAG6363912.1 hypothetical protein INS49_009015 [Diaporthe citri]
MEHIIDIGKGRLSVDDLRKGQIFGSARKVPQAYPDHRVFPGPRAYRVIPVLLALKAWMALRGHQALEACPVHKGFPALRAFRAIKDLLDVTGGMGYLAKMEHKDQRAIWGLKESKVNQERWGHLVKMAYQESQESQESQECQEGRARRARRVTQVIQAKKVTEESRANRGAEDHRVREEYLEKEVARVREEYLEKEDVRAREEHLGKEDARAREGYREYKDCKASRCIAYLPSRDDPVASA